MKAARRMLLGSGVLAAVLPSPGLEIVLQDGLDGYAGTDDCGLYAPESVAEINYGVVPVLDAGVNRWREDRVVLLRFGLTDLPRGLAVRAARLEIDGVADTYPFREITLEAAPLTASNAGWAEGENDGTRVPVKGTACWNWMAQGTCRWEGEAGLRRGGIDPGRAAVSTVRAKAVQTVAFEIPADLVQGWLDAPETNGGWRIFPRGTDPGKGDALSIAMSEAKDRSQRPRLILDLEDTPGLADRLERTKSGWRLVELALSMEEYAAWVARAGEPPKATQRLAALRNDLDRLRGLLAGWGDGHAPAGLAEGLDAVTGLPGEARRLLGSDRAAAYAAERGLPPAFILGTATSMDKVFRRDVPFLGPFADCLRVEAAGNEYEAAQAVVVPGDRDLRNVTWDLALLPETAASGIELGVAPVGYIKSDRPQLVTPHEPSQWWPDPILDFLRSFDCPRGEVQPLWISVRVPPGTARGTYTAMLTVRAEGVDPRSIRVEVRVFGFDLPAEQHLRTAWGMNEGNFARFYKDGYDEAMAWKYFDLFLRHRMAPSDIYRTRPTGRQGDDSLYHLASVDALRRLRERGSAWWNIGYVVAPDRLPEDRKGSYDAYLAECVELFRPEIERVEAAGWPRGSYGIYFLDETSNVEALAQAARLMRESFPGVPLITTGYDRSYGVGTESPAAEFLDIWVPLTPRYEEDLDQIVEGRKLGKQVWWYVCVGPNGRDDLNWFLQFPAIRARLLMGAAAWKYRPDGFLYYRVAGWIYHDRPILGGPMTDWLPRYHPTLPDGDGQIICAGPDGPLTTIRLENIRDGIEDYEYWWMLRDLLKTCGDSAPEAALLTVPHELLRDLRHYSEDPGVLYAVRRRIAEAIEGFPKAADVHGAAAGE